MKIIGITGSSGAGKSTVCEIIEELYDVCIINADKIAKKLGYHYYIILGSKNIIQSQIMYQQVNME